MKSISFLYFRCKQDIVREIDSLVDFIGQLVDKSIKNSWRMIPACIFSSIWIKSNRRCFDGVSTSIGSLKAKCIASLLAGPLCTQFVDFLAL
ncbi:hypothetical protein H5410_009250 [Solanum commersonii]|uniref:Uncharacterized protein n=1 Tax=Solanum commersonii TaxID=4109 RepID=A0A9J6AHG2_SOLCO|nr:hypothetical protein H5410_009250 [Solanum commersonii]